MRNSRAGSTGSGNSTRASARCRHTEAACSVSATDNPATIADQLGLLVTHDRFDRGRAGRLQRRDLTRREHTLTPGCGDSREFVEEPATMHQRGGVTIRHPTTVTKPGSHRHRPIHRPLTTGLQPTCRQRETGRFTFVGGPRVDELGRREHDLIECAATGSHTPDRTGVRSPDQPQIHIPYGQYRYQTPRTSPHEMIRCAFRLDAYALRVQRGNSTLDDTVAEVQARFKSWLTGRDFASQPNGTRHARSAGGMRAPVCIRGCCWWELAGRSDSSKIQCVRRWAAMGSRLADVEATQLSIRRSTGSRYS